MTVYNPYHRRKEMLFRKRIIIYGKDSASFYSLVYIEATLSVCDDCIEHFEPEGYRDDDSTVFGDAAAIELDIQVDARNF